MYPKLYIATTYDCGAYGSSSYSSTASVCATTTSTPGNSVLTNTGFDVLIGVTVACVLVFAALVVRFWRKPVPVKQEADN